VTGQLRQKHILLTACGSTGLLRCRRPHRVAVGLAVVGLFDLVEGSTQ
jgi:hypothetical protein